MEDTEHTPQLSPETQIMAGKTAQKLAALQAQGMQINPMTFIQMQMHALLNVLAPDDDTKVAVETEYQGMLASMVEQALKQAREHALLQGVDTARVNGKRLIVPGEQ